MATQEEEVEADMSVSAVELAAVLGPALANSTEFVRALVNNQGFVTALFASTFFQQQLKGCVAPQVGAAVAAGINR